MMGTSIEMRPPTAADAPELGRMVSNPGIYGVVAEKAGRIVGSNFLNERSQIAGVGPITVDPAAQASGVGRALMEDVLARADERGAPGVRLLQSAYHSRSLSLYAKLGFRAHDVLAVMQGDSIGEAVPGHAVRPATADDIETCNRLCVEAHGFDRGGELRDAVAQGVAQVVEHDGGIAGYTTSVAFFGHSIAATNDALIALISAAPEFGGPGLLLPPRNVEVFNWAAERGLQVVFLMTLMARGEYREPSLPFMPSVLY
jgi:L-amino acid N-acyltransferase YncA